MAETFTGAGLFIHSLHEHGIKVAFVNLGSDHPALVETLARQKVDKSLSDDDKLAIFTSPNEMVGLSAAHGYAQLTGDTPAVLVHVDCGTQALAGAVHNVSRSRVPVLIYAGASPHTSDSSLQGGRNEWIHWIQNTIDQPSIVRQFVKYVGEFRRAVSIDQVVGRSLQLARSEPTGPVYVWGVREATEEFLTKEQATKKIIRSHYAPLVPQGISPTLASEIAQLLLSATSPLIITSYVGRDPKAVPILAALAQFLQIPVFQSCPTHVNLPHSHPCHVGSSFGMENPFLAKADLILIIDSDIPWVELFTKPAANAKIVHLDIDPLKPNLEMWQFNAEITAQCTSRVALGQIHEAIKADGLGFQGAISRIEKRKAELVTFRTALKASWKEAEEVKENVTVPAAMAILREIIPKGRKTLVLSESITNYPLVWDHIRPEEPARYFTSGASSLGWSLGAAVGMGVAFRHSPTFTNQEDEKPELTVVVVGDGSYMFGVPSSAFWMARRYQTPFLTIVLNNGGWRAPTLSMLGVYPDGVGSTMKAAELNCSFGPEQPDYGGIAAAAGGAWHVSVDKGADMEKALNDAVKVVLEEKRCAVVRVVLPQI